MSRFSDILADADHDHSRRAAERNKRENLTDLVCFVVVNIGQAFATGFAIWVLIGMMKG